MYRSSSGHFVYSSRVARQEWEGGEVFRNFLVQLDFTTLHLTKLSKFLPIQELLPDFYTQSET